MDQYIHNLMEEVELHTAFKIPIFGGIEIYESTVGCWIVMAVLILIAIILGSNLKVENISKRQALAEELVLRLKSIMEGMLGKEGLKYGEYISTVMIYIGLMNISGMFGLKPPTKDINVPIALALMTILLVQFAAIHEKGVGGWLKGFSSPVAVVTPINILELIIKPLSLCLRLFGNVLGAFIIMEMVELLVPVFVPLIFSMYFDIFDGFLQAYVFTFLSSMYIVEAIE